MSPAVHAGEDIRTVSAAANVRVNLGECTCEYNCPPLKNATARIGISRRHPGVRPTALVVDDHPDLLRAVCALLASRFDVVATARDGLEAAHLFRVTNRLATPAERSQVSNQTLINRVAVQGGTRARQQLATAFVRQINPALRLDRPPRPDRLIGRDEVRESCRRALQAKRSVGLSGPAGIGKTTLGAAVVTAEPFAARRVFWYTFIPGLNDQLGSVLFSLGLFLWQQGAANLWAQLIAEPGRINPALLLGLLREDLKTLSETPPLLCFDEVDLLRPAEVEAHTQVVAFLGSLRSACACLFIGQRPVIEVDEHYALAGLDEVAVQQYLAAAEIDLLARAGAARLLHPVGAAILVEDIAVEPDVGEGTILFPGVVVGRNVRVGAGCRIYPNVVLYDDVSIGDRAILHSGCVVGSDGFGFAPSAAGYKKIPQVGTVEIAEDVELGANTTVDRAALGVTRIGRGTKLDNLVQVGHNVVIGTDTVIASQTGISGSCKVGNRVMIGGQAGLAGHLEIEDGIMLGAKCGVPDSLKASTSKVWSGIPAMPHGTWAKPNFWK